MEEVHLCAAVCLLVITFICEATGLQEVASDLKVVIDTDGGVDDAMAILMMLSKQNRVRVLAITCVRGNTGVENATRNVLLTQQVANRIDIPVFMGSSQGMVYEGSPTNYYGYDGLGDVFVKPPLDLKRGDHAATALVNLIKGRPGEVSVLCIGPLTNIALAIHLYPRFLFDVKEVVILGGSYKGSGNVKPGVEFNMFMDPEAAEFVFSKVPKGKTITLLPMETVEENAYPMTWRLRDLGKIDSGFVRFLNKAERLALKNGGDFWEVLDPMAAGILLDPSIMTGVKYARVSVETCGERGRGAMFVDSSCAVNSSECSNVKIVTDVAKVQFQSMLLCFMTG